MPENGLAAQTVIMKQICFNEDTNNSGLNTKLIQRGCDGHASCYMLEKIEVMEYVCGVRYSYLLIC
jgi:hypothetical protein